MTAEIPVWVFGKQLWVTGVDKTTTVSDVVEILTGQRDKEFGIVEKWRKVERLLNNDTKILKLWKTWGSARNEIQLSLKKASSITDGDSGRSSPTSICRKRRKHKSSCKYGQTAHPRRLVHLSKNQNIEKLLKLILLQGETIQTQINKLKDRESEIEKLEDAQRISRINSVGTNYLIENYLGDDSGVATEGSPSSENTVTPTNEEATTIDEDVESEMKDLEERIALMEKIVKINKNLEKEEENLVRLYINVERCKKNDKVMEELTESLEKLKSEMESKENDLCDTTSVICQTDRILSRKKCYLQKLQSEMAAHSEKPENPPEKRFFKNNNLYALHLPRSRNPIITENINNCQFHSLPSCVKSKPTSMLDTLV